MRGRGDAAEDLALADGGSRGRGAGGLRAGLVPAAEAVHRRRGVRGAALGERPPADGSAGRRPSAPAAQPVDLATGSFVSREHETVGTARVVQLPDGQVIVRLEGFETSNGPALYVYLSQNPADGTEAAFDDEFVDLGALKGNVGDQNYVVPAGVDAVAFTSVVIWCDRFDAAFGAADLAPVAA